MPVVAPFSGDTRGVSDSSSNGSIVPFSPEAPNHSAVYALRHGLKPPIARLSISWSRGNTLRVSVLRQPSDDGEAGGRVVEVNLSNGDAEISDAQWRRIAYGSVTPFALLQSRRSSVSSLSKMSISPSHYHVDWWEYVMEYSKDIVSLLGHRKSPSGTVIEDPREIVKTVEEPTSLKAAWDLMEIFYADKQSQPWLPERLVDWLTDYDCLLSSTQTTVHSKLVGFQKELVSLQVIEDYPKYWEVISSALAIGWLELVVKMLRLHGSYELDQLGNRETENGLVEAVAVLISKMPRMRLELAEGKAGECFMAKPDFMKAIHSGNPSFHLTMNRIVLSVAGFDVGNYSLFPLLINQGLESMNSLAQKCMQLKPMSSTHRLIELMVGILGENTEVVLAECSRAFGPWMVAHATELMTAGSDQAEVLLHEERDNLGEMSIAELHRLVYAQVLASHVLTWQIAPVYLISCMKQGMGLLELLLCKQPVQHNETLLKNIEICRLYDLDSVSSNIMKVAGVYHWKHGRKGAGVFWLQQARDEVRLNRIAKYLFDSVGKSISDESFKQWEGLIELLGSESKTAGGLDFLHKYRDFKKSLKQVQVGKTTDASRQAAESLISLMKNPSTPQQFWLPLLYDSLKLLNWQERPLLSVSQTNLLLNKLQELSMAKLRPDFIEVDLPPQALSSVRLALATNLGRAILEE
ncbi:hypothetical protein L484_010709 [Morus notabilis]|uniref:Nuclear pore complex protein Nup85 n=1 Tax=Morus notabilis TaxID=981085 RepID=W9RR62_9ROSA|nr:hypothetical protein L484_010709 [Morus notabilis]